MDINNWIDISSLLQMASIKPTVCVQSYENDPYKASLFQLFHNVYALYVVFKDRLSPKTKHLNIHLYFNATKYLWNNALVNYTDS